MKHSKYAVACAGLLCAAVGVAQASETGFFIEGGPTFMALRNTTAVPLSSNITNDYRTNAQTHWTGLWGFGIERTFQNLLEEKPFELSLGLAGYMISQGQVKGTEYPLANDGIYDTLNYQFNTKSNALMVESRWFYTGKTWRPFALIGIGESWNHFSHYIEEPTDPALTAAPVPIPFSNATQGSFAYEFGLGVQHAIFHDEPHHVHYTASIDYRYVNFGNGHLGPIPTQTTVSRLHINGLYTQGILITLKAACDSI